MKKIKMILVSAFLLFISENILPTKARAQVSVSFQTFYNDLSPYGSWVSYPDYGYAWSPGIHAGFRPYVSNGRWVYTDLGWTWVSNYDWGWAPFHYGSWLYDPGYGWLWVPGYDWAPAWVVWGTYNDYYGWAPCAPGFSISIGYHPPMDYWCFAQPHYIVTGAFATNYIVATNRRISIGSNTPITNVNNITIVNNTNKYGSQQFNAGPSRENFEHGAKMSIQPVAIREITKPGKSELNGSALQIYRPKVNASDRNSAKPSKVTPIENIKSGKENGKTNKEAPSNHKVQNVPQPAPKNNSKNINRVPTEKYTPVKPAKQNTQPSDRTSQPVGKNHQQSQPQKISPSEKQSMPRPENQPPQRMPHRAPTPVRQPRQQNQQPPEMRSGSPVPSQPIPEPQPERREEPKGPHDPK